MNKKLDPKKVQVLLIVANSSYSTHAAFKPEEWLKTKQLFRKNKTFIDLNAKLNKLPKIATWHKL